MNDDTLMQRTATGDTSAFTDLVDRHQQRLILWLTHNRGQSQQDAEDIAQETFMSVFKAALEGRYKPVAFRSWLRTIATNLVIDRSRRIVGAMADILTRRDTIRDSRAVDDWDMVATFVSREPDPADVVEERERTEHQREYAWAYMDDVDESQACVLLDYFGGMSYSEQAARDGVPLPTVKSRARLCREKLAIA